MIYRNISAAITAAKRPWKHPALYSNSLILT